MKRVDSPVAQILGGVKKIDQLADDFINCIAVEVLGTCIPHLNPMIEILGDNAVLGRAIEHILQKLLGLEEFGFKLYALTDVS